MTSLPPLRSLQAFRYAARSLSFKAAAEAMNISQAAVSTHIRNLEETLGFRLFVRMTREVRLTEEGGRLADYVENGFQELERGIAQFAPNSHPTHLKVATLPSFASRWLVPRISRFQEKHPSLKISLTPAIQLVDFQSDGMDIAIRYGKGNYRGLETRLLMEETFLPVCHDSLLQGRSITAADVPHLPWLIDDSVDIENVWLEFQRRLGVDIPDSAIKLSVTESSTLVEAILAGRGIALVRRSLVGDLLRSKSLRCPIDISLPGEYHYYLVAPPAKFQTQKVRAFVSWITGEVERR